MVWLVKRSDTASAELELFFDVGGCEAGLASQSSAKVKSATLLPANTHVAYVAGRTLSSPAIEEVEDAEDEDRLGDKAGARMGGSRLCIYSR